MLECTNNRKLLVEQYYLISNCVDKWVGFSTRRRGFNFLIIAQTTFSNYNGYTKSFPNIDSLFVSRLYLSL